MTEVAIHYKRLPDRLTVFRQDLIVREGGCVVTLMERTPLDGPVYAGEREILHPDAPVVWFTFEGAWHDIGRFHDADGRCTGFYANVLTPVQFMTAVEWSTTDLCLDVFLHLDGRVDLLDEDELEHALRAGWVDEATAARAQAEAQRLVEAADAGQWPPPIVRHWDVERARRLARS
jgi:predicted RNA-binding protein associated with RNAse of E/G family